MKKRHLLLLTLCLTLLLFASNLFAQRCTQLNLPENAIARLCTQDNQRFLDLAFSPDGKTLASVVNWIRKVVLWDIEENNIKLTIPDVNGRTVSFSPDGKTLVCGDVVYDATTGEPTLLLLDGEGYRDYVSYSPDGKAIAGAGAKGIRFWKSKVEEPTPDAVPVGDMSINVLPTDTSEITNKESPTSTPIATSSTTVPGINGLSYSPDSKELAIPCELGIWIYDTQKNSEKALLTKSEGGHIDSVRSVVYSRAGNLLASGGRREICLWDAKAKKLKSKIYNTSSGYYYLGTILALDFSHDDKHVVSGDDGYRIHIWDTEKAEYKYTLTDYRSKVISLAFSPDGKTIASSGYHDNTILLYDFTSYPIMSISPDSVTSLTIGEELTFEINITNADNLSGYQATIDYDPDALEYIETKYNSYLDGGVPVQPIANHHYGTVQLASLSLSGIGSHGDGILATIRFKVKAIRTSKLGLGNVILSDGEGNKSYAWIDGAEILKSVVTEDGQSVTCSTIISEDVNKDCVVNIQDLVLVATNFGKGGDNPADVNFDSQVNIIDLVLVAAAFGEIPQAPAIYGETQEIIVASDVRQWLYLAKQMNLPDSTFQHGIQTLEHLAKVLAPKETVLLPNYPNPFNPETWIPYQLAKPADVSILIYSANGAVVRMLQLGNIPTGNYTNRSRAAYWDGRNDLGEPVASGIYFYVLTAGDFTATRKMLIKK